MEIQRRILHSALWAFTSAALVAQPLYVGVKGGLLLTPSSESSRATGRQGQTDTQLELRRYSVGPSLEVALPARWRIETGLLYRSFEAHQVNLLGDAFRTFTSLNDKRWEIPLALRREFSPGSVRPFASGGGVWTRCVRDIEVLTADNLSQPPIQTMGKWSETDNLFGWTGSAGVRFRAPMGLKITPEVRYTRWTAKRWLPSQNQVDLFLGIGF